MESCASALPPFLWAAVGHLEGAVTDHAGTVSVVSGQGEELDKEERKWEQTGTYCFLCVCHHIQPQSIH